MRQTALDTVFEIAKKDSRILFIGSDLGSNTLEVMRQELPNQFMMEGISEQHIIGFAAGLAKEGFIPFVNTIANFLSRRALEQIILDIALHNLPVKILASGGGMVYAPLGPTHTAIDDLAHMLAIPNINVYSPCDADEMKLLIENESLKSSPTYIRFGKGGEPLVSREFEVDGVSQLKYMGSLEAQKVVVTTGVTVQPALTATKPLILENEVLLVHLPKLNLEYSNLLNRILVDKERILVIEEHQQIGGLLTQILHYCQIHNILTPKFEHISLGRNFVRGYGSQADHFREFGITTSNILDQLKG